MMITALIEGIAMGLTLAFMIGPSFVSLLQTSIHRGYYAGIQFAIGIVLSDITLIALAYFGALQFLGDKQHQLSMGIIGGMIVIIFGLITFTRKHQIASAVKLDISLKTEAFFNSRLLKYVSKGYFMNLFNPFLLIFWLGVMSLVSSRYGIPSKEIMVFFTATIATVFGTDLIKCFIANRIKRLLNTKVLTRLNRVVGIILVVFGISLIIRVMFFI